MGHRVSARVLLFPSTARATCLRYRFEKNSERKGERKQKRRRPTSTPPFSTIRSLDGVQLDGRRYPRRKTDATFSAVGSLRRRVFSAAETRRTPVTNEAPDRFTTIRVDRNFSSSTLHTMVAVFSGTHTETHGKKKKMVATNISTRRTHRKCDAAAAVNIQGAEHVPGVQSAICAGR